MGTKSMSPARTTSVFVLMLVYALTILAVGLWRSIDAEMFKPNAFYFCLAVSALSILGAFLVRGGWKWIGLVVAMAGAATALAFYLWCFITKPEQDASVRARSSLRSASYACWRRWCSLVSEKKRIVKRQVKFAKIWIAESNTIETADSTTSTSQRKLGMGLVDQAKFSKQ